MTAAQLLGLAWPALTIQAFLAWVATRKPKQLRPKIVKWTRCVATMTLTITIRDYYTADEYLDALNWATLKRPSPAPIIVKWKYPDVVKAGSFEDGNDILDAEIGEAS